MPPVIALSMSVRGNSCRSRATSWSSVSRFIASSWFKRPLQLLGADVLVADRGDHGIGRMPLVVIRSGIDPPEAEGDDQEPEQDLDDDPSRPGADRLQHGRAGVIVE